MKLPSYRLRLQGVWSGIGWAFGMTEAVSGADPHDQQPPMRAHVIVVDCR